MWKPAPSRGSNRETAAVQGLQIGPGAFDRRAQKLKPATDHGLKSAGMHFCKADRRVGRARCSLDQVGDVGQRHLIVMLLKNIELPASLSHGPIGVASPAET